MSFAALATGIRSLIIADTGSGGLVNSTTPLITACYTLQAPELGATLPYMVIVPVSEVEEKVFATSPRVQRFLVQLSVFTPSSANVTTGQAIVDRLRTVLDRIAPTVSGFTASQLMRVAGQVFIEEDTIHHTEDYEVALSTT